MPYFFQKLGKMLQNLLSAAAVIGAFRVKIEKFIKPYPFVHENKLNTVLASGNFCSLLITFANNLDPD